MAHVAFVDSGPTALRAFEVAQRLGHRVTFFQPEDVSYLRMHGVSTTAVNTALCRVDEVIPIACLAEDLTAGATALHQRIPIDAIVTTAEVAAIPVAKTAETLNLPTASSNALSLAVDKHKCRERLRSAGVTSPGFARVSTYENAVDALKDIGLPAIIKPTRGVCKEGAFVLTRNDDLADFFDGQSTRAEILDSGLMTFLSEDYIVETYIQGKLCSAEFIVVDGVVRPIIISGRQRALHNPLIEVTVEMPSGLRVEQSDSVWAYVAQVVSALGIDFGLYHVEFIMTVHGPVLVEVNSRIMGGMGPVLYEALTGMNLFETLIRLHLGENVPVPKPKIAKAGLVIAFGPVETGIVPEDLESKLERIKRVYDPFWLSFKLRPGQRFTASAGNFGIIGTAGVAHDSVAAVHEVGCRLIEDVSTALGAELAQPEPYDLVAEL